MTIFSGGMGKFMIYLIQYLGNQLKQNEKEPKEIPSHGRNSCPRNQYVHVGSFGGQAHSH